MPADSAAKPAFLLRPRMLGLHLLALALVAAMALMGWWQLGRYDGQQQQAAAAATAAAAAADPVPLGSVLSADAAFPAERVGAKVTATGRYAAATQFLVRRPLAGRPGYWVVSPLRIDGSAILVVRGWVDRRPAQPLAVPARTVTVTGWLRPPEPLSGPVRVTDPRDPVVPAISTAALVSRLPFDLYSGYLVLAEQRPSAGGGAPALAVVPQPAPQVSDGAGWRNLAYALQWWIFGAFVLFMWWRIVRDARVA